MQTTEAMSPARDPALRASPVALLREPLTWIALLGFIGAAVGLIGTFRQAIAFESPAQGIFDMASSATMQASGETLAAVSLLGVASLLGGFRGVVRVAAPVGAFLILLLAAASAVWFFYFLLRMEGFRAGPPRYVEVSLYAYWCLPSLTSLPFAVAALLRRRWRLGALLAGLCVLAFPVVVVWLLFPATSPASPPSGVHWVLGFFGWGVSLPEAVLWAILGSLFLREARERSLWAASRLEEPENRERARRLYEDGLGKKDLSVVDELVSEDFRDLRHGAKGRPGMERILTDMWKSFPDLGVRVDGQKSEGDLVTTRLSLTGTDHGGVLWYPATGKPASFAALFVDRFSGGKLVEHGGETDTKGLLRQLGFATNERQR